MKSLGQIAYEAYAKHLAELYNQDELLLCWDEESERERLSWEAAALKVLGIVWIPGMHPVYGEQHLAEAEASRTPTRKVLREVGKERRRQDERWGEQNHPDGTGRSPFVADFRDRLRKACDAAAARGEVTWGDVAAEEFLEALSESDPRLLRAELLQLGAVCVAWIEAIDRRK